MIKDINIGGVLIGFVTWLILLWWLSIESECAQYDSCDGGDIILFTIVGIGMLVPSYIAAIIGSVLFKK